MEPIPTLAAQIASQLKIDERRIAAALDLLDSGNTLPFVARYRKEMTGGLDEGELRALMEHASRLRALAERRATILRAIEEQDRLTDDLRRAIQRAATLADLEDLYQPLQTETAHAGQRRAGTGIGRIGGVDCAPARTGRSLADLAAPFLSADVPDMDAAFAGARDIVAEDMSDHATIRGRLRKRALERGLLNVSRIDVAADPRDTFKLYYDLSQPVSRLRPHQILAINRGEAQKVLRVRLEIDEYDWLLVIRAVFRPNRSSELAEQLQLAVTDGAQRLLLPAIERDVRRELTERAAAHAIQVFAANLEGLLTQPPLGGRVVAGIDPAFRTGCKVAVIDSTGDVLATETIYPHQPQKKHAAALQSLLQLVTRHGVTLIAIGNGTASRETEQLVAELLRNPALTGVHYLIVNEAGASVYSASELAAAELPTLDVTLRGAVSIARRVQDPLAELVKIDPRAIGVGLYQHDVNQKQLAEALYGVVESVVNRVGIDLNTASSALLTYVAGIGPTLAERIVAHRSSQGPFVTRDSLRAVKGLGPRAFEQAAGFLRVRNGAEPLDDSAIHPESYRAAREILARAGVGMDAPAPEREAALQALVGREGPKTLAAAVNVGLPTLEDIIEQLARPGRDPRADAPPPILRSDVLSLTDLAQGMVLAGTVRNVVDFGAFVDIGVKQDGLLHRSQVPRGTVLQVGDVIDVTILKIEPERQRIGLGWPGGVPTPRGKEAGRR